MLLAICNSSISKSSYCITEIFCISLQYDAFEIGFITTDDFTNADILEATYPAVAKKLHGDWISDPAIPIVTGFLGKVASLLILVHFLLLVHFLFIVIYLLYEL